MQVNPFTPGFGQIPPYLAGRSYIVRDISTALRTGGADPNLTTLFVGPRGSGKTTLLNLVSAEASSCGWVCAQVSAVPGMLDDILITARREAREIVSSHSEAHISSVGIGGVLSLGWNQEASAPTNWRGEITDLLEKLDAIGSGLLITVDELRGDLDEVVQLASVYQHLVSERRRVSLMVAGLPYQVSRVLNDKSISFLRRASRHNLGRIDDPAIADALKSTVESAGRQIDSEAVSLAVEAIEGSPYMLQLVGYHMWATTPEAQKITVSDADVGVSRAQVEIRERVLETTWDELSEGDIRFLRAMLEDDGDAHVSDIQERLDVSTGYVAQYRRRLMELGVIGRRSRGVVGFDLPGMREFLRDKIAA